jgi:nicotinamidase-related amidase
MAKASGSRALVVIDVQNEYIDGKFLIEYPDIGISLPNVGKAMDAAHQLQIPIVMVQHILPESAPIFARGSHGAEVHPSIASKPYDHLIEKTLPSVFAGTDFGAWLKAHAIDTIVVAGYMTHNCDDSTMRQAMHEGYKVEFLVDAAGSLPYENKAGRVSAKEIHTAVSVVMQSTFAAVVTTDEWIAGLDSGADFERDNIFVSNQRYVATRAGQ